MKLTICFYKKPTLNIKTHIQANEWRKKHTILTLIRKERVAILISSQIDFRARKIITEIMRHYTITKVQYSKKS